MNPNWHREAVGGMWEEIGDLQVNFLVAQGLKPYHYLLDVGCGSLRGGVRYISYLEEGHYYGVDANEELLSAGREIELARYGLADRKANLMVVRDFEFSVLGRKFDYAIAQSVFTHLPLNNIMRCIMNVEEVLVQGGRFYATFFENAGGKHNLLPIMHEKADGPSFPSFFDKNPYHYDFGTFEWICIGTRLSVAYYGDWGHPREQKMLVFTKM